MNHATHMNESCHTKMIGTAMLVQAQLALYGVAMISILRKMIGLFCKRAL